MANEIWQSFDSASTLYALVYRKSDNYIYDVGDTDFEAVGTWNDARCAECAIAMTPDSDVHFADFPDVDADEYFVQVRIRATGSPLASDTPIAQGFLEWDGESELTILTASTHVENIYEIKAEKETKSRIYI